jgi:hypothetical protein
MSERRILRLPELVELVTRPEVVERMIATYGAAYTQQVLLALEAQAERWIATADEFDLTDQRR